MSMEHLSKLGVKLFADGADTEGIARLVKNPLIRGFTTNPTLMRAAKVSDYHQFALQALEIVPHHPISFEVFSDDLGEMERQGHEIASWGKNVYVKIPVTNTQRKFTGPVVHRLANSGVQVNVTAILTLEQVENVLAALPPDARGYISVFAGRIADTGRDPMPIMAKSVEMMRSHPHLELIWASPRELLNIVQADQVGCHVITVSHDLLAKLPLIGKDLDEFSLDTVKMFHQDALKAGYRIETPQHATQVSE